MVDPFESPRLLIERARENTQDLAARIKRFFADNPQRRVVEVDPKTGEHIHKAVFDTPIPSRLGPIAFDIAGGLRASLDHAVYASAVALGADRPKSTKFPAGDTADDVRRELDKKCGGIHPQIKDLIQRVAPHKGGQEPLWALNKFRNAKHHRVLAVMATIPTGSVLSHLTVNGGPMRVPMPRWNPEKCELVYLITGPGAQVQYHVNIPFFVTFGEVDGLGGAPVIPAFTSLAEIVEGVVNAIEAETARILRERS